LSLRRIAHYHHAAVQRGGGIVEVGVPLLHLRFGKVGGGYAQHNDLRGLGDLTGEHVEIRGVEVVVVEDLHIGGHIQHLTVAGVKGDNRHGVGVHGADRGSQSAVDVCVGDLLVGALIVLNREQIGGSNHAVTLLRAHQHAAG